MSNHNPFSSNHEPQSTRNPWARDDLYTDHESTESNESSPYFETPTAATRTRPTLPAPPVPPRRPNVRNEHYRNEPYRNETDYDYYSQQPTLTNEPSLPRSRSVHFSNPDDLDPPPHVSTPRPPPFHSPLYRKRTRTSPKPPFGTSPFSNQTLSQHQLFDFTTLDNQD